MKIGEFARTNSKGQIVIPKSIRKVLGIDSDTTLNIIVMGNNILISPVEEFITKLEKEDSYSNILKKTQGTWSGDDWEETEAKRKDLEIKSSSLRKKIW